MILECLSGNATAAVVLRLAAGVCVCVGGSYCSWQQSREWGQGWRQQSAAPNRAARGSRHQPHSQVLAQCLLLLIFLHHFLGMGGGESSVKTAGNCQGWEDSRGQNRPTCCASENNNRLSCSKRSGSVNVPQSPPTEAETSVTLTPTSLTCAWVRSTKNQQHPHITSLEPHLMMYTPNIFLLLDLLLLLFRQLCQFF